jgi:hypothetical protein
MTSILLATVIVLALWAIVGYAIWQWGPGLRKRSVWCPILKKRAKVLAEQREALFVPSYAGLTMVDIKQCSLFEGGPPDCQKECLQHQ